MTGLVNGIVVDVDHVHALNKRLPVGAFHADDVFIFQSYAG